MVLADRLKEGQEQQAKKVTILILISVNLLL